ncbi:RE2 [Symbiodinium sp. CCMP2592]|nr:RE2 [Symbiodinium sp. CCMP2592]
MDPMVRSRRGAAGQGEPVATGAFSEQLEQEYSAALSQADSGIVPRGSSYVDQGACPPGLRSAVAPGEASPGTLEQGGVVGGAAGASTSSVGGIPSLPTASPFHSARVQEEVALQRKRPSGLDQEQARVGSGNLDMEGGLEPNYSAAFDTAERFGPRVARVEAVGPREAATLEGSVVGPGREGVSTGMPMLEEKRDSAAGLQPGVAVEGLDPPDDDAPELLPDNDRTARLEQVVAQLIDENRSLKIRVEQAELRSHSSWHSGTPGEVLASPMSFAMDGGVPPGGLEGAVPANFPGCRIKHPKKGCLDVTVVKGCPLIPREVGLALLSEYEGRRVGAPLISKVEVMDLQTVLTPEQSRVWLRDRLVQRGEGLTDVDQLVFLRGMFPGIPMELLARACVPALDSGFVDWGESPWNRRFRRSVGRAASGSVLISVSSGQSLWKGLGKVVAVSDSKKGLGSRLVFQLLLNWAEKGKVGGLIQGDGVFETGAKAGEFSWDSQVHASSDWRTLCEGSVKILRWFLLFSVAQASKDARSECLPNSGKKESAQSPSPPASAVASRDDASHSAGATGIGAFEDLFPELWDLPEDPLVEEPADSSSPVVAASGYDDCSSELSDASEGEEPKSWTEEGLLGVWGSEEEIEGDTGEVPGVYEIQVLDCAVGQFKGGGLWVESEDDQGDLAEQKESAASQAKAVVEEQPGDCRDEWEVDLPCWIVDDADRDSWCRLHQGEICFKKFLVEELGDEGVSPELFALGAERLYHQELRCEWLEQVLRGCQAESEVCGSIKALQVEVPIGEGDSKGDQFLQTRTIGLAEARRELTCWKEPAQEEVTSLEVTNEADVRVDVRQVDQWVEQGIAVIQLPGKCVLTRKSGTGRRRCRAVCCGNYLPAEKLGLSRDDLYASGAEGVTLRTALAFAARFAQWRGFTIDVKSAFLYAPIGAEAKGKEERIVVKPPSFLTELGILKSTDRWWVKKALYGLPTSPKDWGNYRDQEFRRLQLRCSAGTYGLVQSKADESLWFLREVKGNEFGDVVGLLVVYVDDLAVFSLVAICEAFIQAVQEKWKTSAPTWFGEEPVTFCGVEIVLTGRGYRLAQTAYLRELLHRYDVKGTAAVPVTKWTDPELPGEVDLAEVRPDISFAVSKMGQMVLEIYSDASHSPNGDRSTQCVIVMWRGSPLVWESTRQPFTTLSSAESELVAMVHSVQITESLQSLIDEMLEEDTGMALMGDNAAAVRSFDMAGNGWRNRHLRMRAVSCREKVLAGILHVSHLPGADQVADIGTKALTRVRLMQLLELLNIREPLDVLGAVRFRGKCWFRIVHLVPGEQFASPAGSFDGVQTLTEVLASVEPAADGQLLVQLLTCCAWVRLQWHFLDLNGQAEGTIAYEAAFAYFQSGDRRYPFFESEDEEIDDRPHRAPRELEVEIHRPVYALEESSSEDSSSSTEEPSIVSESVESESTVVYEPGPEAIAGPSAGTAVLVSGPIYEAAEGALLVHYVDDMLRVPLDGWTVEEVEVVVEGLRTGDWTGFSQRLDEVAAEGGIPGSSSDPPPVIRARSRLRRGVQGIIAGLRGILWSLFLMWFLVQGVRAQEVPENLLIVWPGPPVASGCAAGTSVASADLSDAASLGWSSDCDGSTLWEILKGVLLLVTWEVGRWILFALWIAGYQVDADDPEYSDRGTVFSDEGSLSDASEGGRVVAEDHDVLASFTPRLRAIREEQECEYRISFPRSSEREVMVHTSLW